MKRNEDKKQPKESIPRNLKKSGKFNQASAAQFESSKTDFIEDDDEVPR